MKDESSFNPTQDPNGNDGEVIALLQDLQRRVLFLERKIDLLIGHLQDRPCREASPDRMFRKGPYGSTNAAGRPRRHGGEERQGPKKTDPDHTPFYERRPRGRKKGAAKKRLSSRRRE